jgi:4-hydroxybenzoate polyprenyltransferase/phosphoserine phosphatase
MTDRALAPRFRFADPRRRDAARMPSLLDIETRIPLVIDLDGTLTPVDTLRESFIALALLHPLAALTSLSTFGQGLAAFKRTVAQHAAPDAASLPYRSGLIELAKSERARGRQIHLVTASDQSVADAVAAEVGVFDSACGSDGAHNLKGPAKLDYLSGRFPDGFIYAGDAPADVPVFRAARGAILCDASSATTAAVRSAGTPVLAEFRTSGDRVAALLRALRPHQWSKNLLIFVPLLVGHAYADPAKILAAVLGFLTLCALASATYLLNDIADLAADREHPTKRLRPFASGVLSITAGLIAAPVLIAVAFGGALLLSPRFAGVLLIYFVLTLSYSLGLKRVPLLDVFIIGLLFTLRIVMGSQAAGIGHSPWLLSFALAFFVSLALAKRHGEVLRAARIDVEEIVGRGYRGDDWPVTLSFGIGAGLVSILIMLLYMTNDAAPSGFYRTSGWLYAMPAVVSLWLMRIWLLSNRLMLHDDPVVFALKDRVSLALGLLAAIVFYLAI